MPVTIVSIFPQELTCERSWSPNRNAGCHTYILPSADGKSHTKLVVNDAYQWCYMGETIGNRSTVIPAEQVARDLVTHWVENRLGNKDGNTIGVFIAKGAEPTSEELERAQGMQSAHMNYVIDQADAAYRQGRLDLMPEVARTYAKWMGRGDLPWIKEAKRKSMKECPLCYAEIPAKATFCQVCRQQISKLPKGMEA